MYPIFSDFRYLRVVIDIVDHRLQLLRVSLDSENDGSLFDAVGRRGHRRDDLPAVGKTETHGKGAVRTQLNRLALKRDPGVRFGGSVDDQLGIQVEPEFPHLAGRISPRAKTGYG